MSECYCRLSNPHSLCVQVQAEVATDGGPEILREVHEFQLVIVDGDGGSRLYSAIDVRPLKTDSQHKVFAVCCEWVALKCSVVKPEIRASFALNHVSYRKFLCMLIGDQRKITSHLKYIITSTLKSKKKKWRLEDSLVTSTWPLFRESACILSCDWLTKQLYSCYT